MLLDLPGPALQALLEALHDNDLRVLKGVSRQCNELVTWFLPSTIKWHGSDGMPPPGPVDTSGFLHLWFKGPKVCSILSAKPPPYAARVTRITLEGCEALDDLVPSSLFTSFPATKSVSLIRCSLNLTEAPPTIQPQSRPQIQQFGFQQLTAFTYAACSQGIPALMQLQLPNVTDLNLCLYSKWTRESALGVLSRLRSISISSGRENDMLGMSNTHVAHKAAECLGFLVDLHRLTQVNLGRCQCAVDDDMAAILFWKLPALTHLTVCTFNLNQPCKDSPAKLRYLCLTPCTQLPVKVDSLALLNLTHLTSPILIKSKHQVHFTLPAFYDEKKQTEQQAVMQDLLDRVQGCGGISWVVPALELVCTCATMAAMSFQLWSRNTWSQAKHLHLHLRYSHCGGSDDMDMTPVYEALAQHLGPQLKHLRITCRGVPNTACAAALGSLSALKTLTILPSKAPTFDDLAHIMLVCNRLGSSLDSPAPAPPAVDDAVSDTSTAPHVDADEITVKVVYPRFKNMSIGWWQAAVDKQLPAHSRVKAEVKMLGDVCACPAPAKPLVLNVAEAWCEWKRFWFHVMYPAPATG